MSRFMSGKGMWIFGMPGRLKSGRLKFGSMPDMTCCIFAAFCFIHLSILSAAFAYSDHCAACCIMAMFIFLIWSVSAAISCRMGMSHAESVQKESDMLSMSSRSCILAISSSTPSLAAPAASMNPLEELYMYWLSYSARASTRSVNDFCEAMTWSAYACATAIASCFSRDASPRSWRAASTSRGVQLSLLQTRGTPRLPIISSPSMIRTCELVHRIFSVSTRCSIWSTWSLAAVERATSSAAAPSSAASHCDICTLVHAVCPSFSETILSQPRMHSKLTTLNGGEAMADWTIKRATPSEDIHTSEMAIVQSITLEKQASA
mmetsp:Transcript_26280/g.87560  ORF Transcript_26280/g.87560 Transcript_26280/m.87560 type:complete len:320 (+) Transcript_26280:1043-2002(+)